MRDSLRTRITSSIACLCIWVAAPGHSAPYSPDDIPTITIIIDDLGNRYTRDKRALELHGPVTYSILPHTPYARPLSKIAAQLNKEVMLHLPMQPVGTQNMGDGGLNIAMEQAQFLDTLRSNMHSVDHFVGINNHMGSLLTQYPRQMRWLMQEIKSKGTGLFYVDSMTSAESVAAHIAQENDIPVVSRDVFLDHDQNLAAVAYQFSRLINIAQNKGHALAIGHPHLETLTYLEYWLPHLERKGVKLVTITDYVDTEKRSSKTWQASLSPSPKVAKNLKQ